MTMRDSSTSGDALTSNPWRPDTPGVVEALRTAELVDLKLVYDSSNYVFISTLDDPIAGRGLGVYKPENGERPLHDFPLGTLYQREVAAYALSQLLGWDLVPPTVEREGPHGVGSLQLFIDHRPREHYFALRESDEYDERLAQIAVFDLVANNADRKGGHVLLDPEGQLWCIDNGLCFHHHAKLRTVIWDYAGTRAGEPWVGDLQRARECVLEGDAAAEELRACLDETELEALVSRIDEFVADPVLPEMYPWRCVPWPLV
jgi:uncharacterized repeat protein (TIGR03843 family)